jgi:hypothetical protein
MIEEDRQQQLNKQNQNEIETTEDDIELDENLERDGECKLCGSPRQISSKT